jgi:hypothetical protein
MSMRGHPAFGKHPMAAPGRLRENINRHQPIVTMIPNHNQFLEAIRDRKLVRIVYYSRPDAGTVDRECAPLDYGQDLGSSDGLNRYWVWDAAAAMGTNPLGLVPDQIVHVHILGKDFDPGLLQLGTRSWHVLRDWGTHPELAAPVSPAPVAPPTP